MNENILGSTDIDKMGNPEFVADDSPISSTDLLSCPFCGGEADYFEDRGRITGHPVWSVGCETEDCFGFVSMTEFARKAQAREAWNKRADNYKEP